MTNRYGSDSNEFYDLANQITDENIDLVIQTKWTLNDLMKITVLAGPERERVLSIKRAPRHLQAAEADNEMMYRMAYYELNKWYMQRKEKQKND